MSLLISSKASLPSLRVLNTNQESDMPIKKVNKANEKIVLLNLFRIEMIKIIFCKISLLNFNFNF